ncbi:serine/threonine-protein phosphatase [Glycomyces sp. L485]|uniref:PP2C family protein-serine/threonine phosphatase n=1 Tax=Glycomyces sp. L485 TaxID=2909235 RepID=UPI001F4AB5C2|nr:PP2C family protein-serine/threonine phosphatase [Glycomyces sp. L485]MCH7231548.1 serine/threonine-protein phosphatase [Glycomyces sp. L485]
MGRMREAHQDQGFTRSYLPNESPWTRITGGDPRSVLWLRLLPLLAMTPLVFFAIDPDFLRYTYLIFTFPVLTALVNGPVATTLAVLAVATFVASGRNAFGLLELPASGWPDVIAILSLGSLSVLLAWIRDRVVLRLLKMTSVAETTQLAILPELPEHVGPLKVASAYRTAAGSPGLVGGDFFDVHRTDHGIRLAIGDVQGHGLSTVRITEAVLGSFREGVLDDPDLTALAARLERRVALDNRGRSEWEQTFATAALIEIPPGEHLVRVMLCGHPPPLIVHDRTEPLSPKPRPPLGLAEFGPTSAEVLERPLRPGALIIAYSDGLVEARNRAGENFPLIDLVDRHVSEGERDPHRLRARLRHDFRTGRYVRSDDTTLLITRLVGDADRPAG